MFASIRRYQLHAGALDELTRRVDEGFAEEISAQPGFVSYEFIDCDDGEVMTISLFRTAEAAEASDELALEFVRDQLGSFDIERTEAIGGEVVVSRAMAEVLEPTHA